MFMFRIYFINHGYFADETADTIVGAVELAKRFHFDCVIYRRSVEPMMPPARPRDSLIAGWGVISGLRFYEGDKAQAARAEYHAAVEAR
jgi:hypothetical protein